MRRTYVEDDESMDSLLDTLMNVVGILIIVLVVTQLGVGEAVQRIGKTMAVDPATLQQTEEELVVADRQRDSLDAMVQDLQQVDEGQITQRLEDLVRQLSERQKELDQLTAKLQTKQVQAAENKKLALEIQENKALLDKLRKEILAVQEEEARLKAILDETRPRQELPPIEVNLPNPRPAPANAKPILLICSHDKLYPLNTEQFQIEGRELGLKVIQSARLELHLPVNESQKVYYLKDPKEFLRLFNKRPPTDRYFRTELIASGSSPRLIFHPLADAGETERSINRSSSRFRKQLKAVDASSYYIRLNVCSDSFDVYVMARRIISRVGLLAGWEPQAADWQYATNLGGAIRFGPPPKPQPKPTAPPKTTKTPPAKPVNVID